MSNFIINNAYEFGGLQKKSICVRLVNFINKQLLEIN